MYVSMISDANREGEGRGGEEYYIDDEVIFSFTC